MKTIDLLAPESTAVELSHKRFRKQILKAGEMDYGDRKLQFTNLYFQELIDAFNRRAFDAVPLQIDHDNDPDRTRGEVVKLEATGDGLFAHITVSDRGAELIRENPKLGVSVRMVEDYQRGDSQHFPVALQHVALTWVPRLTGMKPFEPLDLSHTFELTAEDAKFMLENYAPSVVEANINEMYRPVTNVHANIAETYNLDLDDELWHIDMAWQQMHEPDGEFARKLLIIESADSPGVRQRIRELAARDGVIKVTAASPADGTTNQTQPQEIKMSTGDNDMTTFTDGPNYTSPYTRPEVPLTQEQQIQNYRADWARNWISPKPRAGSDTVFAPDTNKGERDELLGKIRESDFHAQQMRRNASGSNYQHTPDAVSVRIPRNSDNSPVMGLHGPLFEGDRSGETVYMGDPSLAASHEVIARAKAQNFGGNHFK